MSRSKDNSPVMITLTLPFPPSLNNYMRQTGNRRYFTKRGLEFKAAVADIVAASGIQPLQGRLSASLRLFAPNKRRFDLDNMVKATLDALEGAGCFPDDGAIDELNITRGPVQKGGAVKVLILSMGAA